MRKLPSVFAVYKPKGISSNQALTEIKKILGVKKAGHAGTLDPLAEGVLVVGIGSEGTSELARLVQKGKEYIAEITFGASSETDDEEGKKTFVTVSDPPALISVKRVIRKFVGDIEQVPPRFSAVHVRGRKAYERARRGESFAIMPRPAHIESIDVLGYTWPRLRFRIVTGPGVYIRALARDIGGALGVGGYISALERTRVGDFKKEDALPLEELKNYLYESR